MILTSENIIIDGVGNDSKVGRAKTKVKYFSKKNLKTTKSKILVRSKNHNCFSKSI